MRTIAPLIVAITLVLPVAVVPAHASASPPGFGPAAPVQTAGTATTPLPIDQVGTVLLDEAHGHLFISTGEGRDAILVTDLAGTVVHRFTGLAEPSGMVLDGTTLHVALRGSEAILAIDTATLTVLGPRSLPSDVCPDQLAITAGRLVYTATNCGDTLIDGWLGTVDLATGSGTIGLTGHRRAVLAATAASAGLVAVADSFSSPSTLFVYEVRGAEPVALRAQTGPAQITDLAMAPTGDSVFVSSPVAGGYSVPLETLAFGRAVSTSASAARWSGDGSRLAVGYDGFVDVWPAGATATVSGVLGPPGVMVRAGQLAVDATGSQGWVVSAEFAQSPILVRYDLAPVGTHWTLSGSRIVLPEFTEGTLRADLSALGRPIDDGVRIVVLVYQPDGVLRTEEHFTRDGGLTVSLFPHRGVTRYRFSHFDPVHGHAEAFADVIGTYQPVLSPIAEPVAPITPGQSLGWFVQLTDREGRPLTDRRVDILLRVGGAETFVEYQLTDRNGFVRFTAEAGDPGSYAYRFFYAGDEAASSAEHLSPLVVEKFTSFVDASGQLGTGKNRRTATVTGFLSNWHTNRVLTITATPDGGMPVVIAQGEVGEDHTLTVQYQIRSATTFTVSYAGDEWYTPGEDSIRLTLR